VASPNAFTVVAVVGSKLNVVQLVKIEQPLTVNVPGTTRLPFEGTVKASPL
jgi:hypothetical protein